MKKVTEIVAELARPVVEEHGCTLWDVEYVREAGQWYLRLLIDKQGGVDILDCEAISRVVSDLLDEADPIEGSYVFEVGSAGAERPLKRPADFEQFMGADVLLKTYKLRDGRKEFSGVLTGYDDGAVAVTEFGPSCAAGTAEKVAEVEAALRDGSLKVFDTATFTVNGETVTSAPCDMTIMDWATGTVAYQGETYEGIVDGAFEESTFRSAPYFTLRIDGIVEDAQ